MPFKGDMRLGGPHDNEANLNGTSSDFEGVPEYGTLIEIIYQTTYPVSNGGSFVVSSAFPNQVCDVDKVADGLGGDLIDWSTARNINYITGSFSESGTYYGTINLPSGNNLGQPTYTYSYGTYTNYYEHDGVGGVNGMGGDSSYTQQGESIVNVSYPAVASGYTDINGYNVATGYSNATWYIHDGIGGFSEENNFEPYSLDTVILEFNQPLETYVYETDTYYQNGLSDIQQYKADGYGNYTGPYSTATTVGSYYPAGDIITSQIDSYSGDVVEINSDYYWPQRNGYKITWDGYGGYNYVTSWYASSGTWFAADEWNNYYWDGQGGYYSEGI